MTRDRLMLRRKLRKVILFLTISFFADIENFVKTIARRYDRPGKNLLDIGAYDSQYRHYFNRLNYYRHDVIHLAGANLDYTGKIEDGLKTADGEKTKGDLFDYLLCLQVLEHIADPGKAFLEFYRILKPGGRLFLTTNFVYQIHMAPTDYFRFTKYGLAHLAKTAGFQIERITPQTGVFQVVSYVVTTLPIRILFKDKPFLYYLYLVVFAPLIVSINLSARLLDRLDKDKELAINYEAVFRKPNY